MTFYKEVNCRACGGELETVFDMGSIYPSAFVDGENPFTERVPLQLSRCLSCQLVQLRHSVDLDLMYRKYYYKSSLNQSMKDALADVVYSAIYHVDLEEGDIVVDIGANDGTLLSYFAPYGVTRVGFDPAENIAEEVKQHCDLFVNDYFTEQNYPYKQKAKVITSIAMFYDLPDPCSFVEGVRSILHDQGIWIMQLTDLTSMLQANAFDNINHEHLEYYTLEWLVDFLSRFSLDVFRVEQNRVNGRSYRLYICHSGHKPIEENVQEHLEVEREFMDRFDDPMSAFKGRIYKYQLKVVNRLQQINHLGQKVYGMAASTKGNTLLQAWGIDNTLIPKIADVNPDKYGRRTVGSDIEIVCEEEALNDQPEYFFVLAWHFLAGFLKRYKSYMEAGGKLFVPLPEPKIYYLDEEGLLRAEYL